MHLYNIIRNQSISSKTEMPISENTTDDLHLTDFRSIPADNVIIMISRGQEFRTSRDITSRQSDSEGKGHGDFTGSATGERRKCVRLSLREKRIQTCQCSCDDVSSPERIDNINMNRAKASAGVQIHQSLPLSDFVSRCCSFRSTSGQSRRSSSSSRSESILRWGISSVHPTRSSSVLSSARGSPASGRCDVQICNTMSLILFSFLIPLLSAQAPPSFTMTPVNYSLVVGSDVTLSCRVSNLNSPMIVWTQMKGASAAWYFIGSTGLSYGFPPSRFQPVPQPGGSDLVITSIQTTDDAVYRCDVANTSLTASATLTVLVPPGQPSIQLNGTTSPDQLTEGMTILLDCNSTGGNPLPTLNWYRDGIPLSGPVVVSVCTPAMFGTACSVLSWVLTKDDHNVPFSCAALNGAVTVNQSLALSAVVQYPVNYAPVINMGPFNPLPAVLNYSVTLNCTADAYPPINPNSPGSIVWTRNNAPIGNGPVVQINSVTMQDAGIYTCTAKNYATTKTNLTLNVLNPPQLVVLTGTSGLIVNGTLQVLEGSTANLTCTGVNTSSFNLSSVIWYRVGSQSVLWVGAAFLLSSVQHGVDDGLYGCDATYSLSAGPPGPYTVTTTVQLRVMYSPVMTASNISQFVDLAASTNIMCNASAFPAPQFSWFRGPVALVNNNSQYQISSTVLSREQGMSTMTIAVISQGDLGMMYSCQATNQYGSGTTSFNLIATTVPYPPSGLTVLSSTWESVYLSWQPGYDGGHTQGFIIVCYSSANSNNVTNILAIGYASTSYNLTDLYPNVNYTCVVSGVNKLGAGNSSNSVSLAASAFVIYPPANAHYSVNSHSLTFSSSADENIAAAPNSLCIRAQYLTSSGIWSPIAPCIPIATPFTGSIQLNISQATVLGVQVFLCLQRRTDICSIGQNVTLVSYELPVNTIIIVVCVCGGVILILCIILIVLCCIRKHCCCSSCYLDDKTAVPLKKSPSLRPVIRVETGSDISTSNKFHTYDNPVLAVVADGDNYFNDHLELRQSYRSNPPRAGKTIDQADGRFSPASSSQYRNDLSPARSNGNVRHHHHHHHHPHHGGSGRNQANVPTTGIVSDRSDSSGISDRSDSSGNDSGVSTNETARAHRIIHEIIV